MTAFSNFLEDALLDATLRNVNVKCINVEFAKIATMTDGNINSKVVLKRIVNVKNLLSNLASLL